MRRRIYWLLPDLASARRTMDDLLLARIDEGHMHFVAREDADMTGLHAANVLQTSDVIRSAEAGLVIGGATGAILGAIVAVAYPIFGDKPEWGLIAVLAIAGAGFGAWATGPKKVPRVSKVYSASSAPIPNSTNSSSGGTTMAYSSASRSQSMCMKTATIKPAFNNMKTTISDHLSKPWKWK